MIEPKDITIDGHNYILSKFPAIAGREIITKYPLSSVPKLGDYKVNEETMLKLMSYVGINVNGAVIKLTTQSLIDNHVPNWEVLAKIEVAMLEYNVSFFQNGLISTFLDDLAQKLPAWILKTWTALQAQSSQKEKRRSTN